MTALYIHIPYCRSKCRYCDFVSVVEDKSIPSYLRALAREAETAPQKATSIHTIYIGGGTPTVLSPAEISRLFNTLRKTFTIAHDAEVTVEANPCSLAPETAWALAETGVNRVSLGAQSFIDVELSLLGRSHGPKDIRRAVSILRQAGIGNISIDLIFGIPNQSMKTWRQSLVRTIELEPRHISTYCLTFEPSTPFWHSLQTGRIEKKSEEEELEFYETARNVLTRSGYDHYEISNFALPGSRSRHNMVYWSNAEYLGLGASAVSYISGQRITNIRDPLEYIGAMESKGNAVCHVEDIPPGMQAVETAIQLLRLREGIDRTAFRRRFGINVEELFNGAFRELVEFGLLHQVSDTVRATSKGWHLANEVALRALP